MGEEQEEEESVSLENAARVEPRAAGPFWTQLSLDDVVVFLFVESIATPINIAAGEAFVSGSGNEWFGWSVGLPLGFLGFTFHWWKGLLPEAGRRWLIAQSQRWATLAIAIAALVIFLRRGAQYLPASDGAGGWCPIGVPADYGDPRAKHNSA